MQITKIVPPLSSEMDSAESLVDCGTISLPEKKLDELVGLTAIAAS
jgi:hypothetical protein